MRQHGVAVSFRVLGREKPWIAEDSISHVICFIQNSHIMKKFLCIAGLISISLFSCSSHPSPTNTDSAPGTDSVAAAQSRRLLSKKLNAHNLEDALISNTYSIDFDTLKRKRVYTDSFDVTDIQKSGDSLLVHLTVISVNNADIYLKAPSSYFNRLKSLQPEKNLIVFEFDDIKKTADKTAGQSDDIEEGSFILKGNLLSIEKS